MNKLYFSFIILMVLTSCKAEFPPISPTTKSSAIYRFVHNNRNMGDVHPVYFNDQLYMFYLKTGGHYQSGLAISTDFLTYTERTINTDPNAKPWSVLYVIKKEFSNEYITYHSTDGIKPNGVLKGSISQDLLNWKLMDEKYTVPVPQKNYWELKDPYVFWNADRGNYWAVRSAKETANSAWLFIYYTSTDLTNWVEKGTLYAPSDVFGPIECPQMFKMGNFWYMLYSEYKGRVGKPQYFYATQPEGPWLVPTEDNSLDGEDNCAAQIVSTDDNLLLYGWIPSKDTETSGFQEWGGPLCIPREVVQFSDGRLGTRIAPQVLSLIRGEKTFGNASRIDLTSLASTTATSIVSEKNTHFDMTVKFSATQATEALGAIIDVTEGATSKKIYIEFSNGMLYVKSDNTVYSSIKLPLTSGDHTLRIISDKDIIECFVDDKYSLAAMVSSDVLNARLNVFTKNGSASFSDIEVYKLANVTNGK